MAYNTSPTLDKQTCTDYVDFGKCQDRFGQSAWTKSDSNNLDIKLNVFKRESRDAEFSLGRNFTMAEADFNQFIRQRNQMQQTTFSKNKICRPFFILHCPKSWRSNWSLFTRWLTLRIAQTERFVWHCCDTRRITQRPPVLKFIYSDGRRRKKSFSNLCMSPINLTNFYIFLTSWIRCMIKIIVKFWRISFKRCNFLFEMVFLQW